MPRDHDPVVGWRDYVDQRFADSARAVAIALAATEKAADKLETATAVQFAGVDALQGAMRDQAARYPTRDEMTAQISALTNRLDELRLAAAGYLTKETHDVFADRQDAVHRDLGDEIGTRPTKAEVRAQFDTTTITVASLNARVADFTSEQAIRASGWMTKEAFEAFGQRQEGSRAASRRAMIGAWVSVGIALTGFAITLILFLVSPKTGGTP